MVIDPNVISQLGADVQKAQTARDAAAGKEKTARESLAAIQKDHAEQTRVFKSNLDSHARAVHQSHAAALEELDASTEALAAANAALQKYITESK